MKMRVASDVHVRDTSMQNIWRQLGALVREEWDVPLLLISIHHDSPSELYSGHSCTVCDIGQANNPGIFVSPLQTSSLFFLSDKDNAYSK